MVGVVGAQPQHARPRRDLDAEAAGPGGACGTVARPPVHQVAHERGDELVLGQPLAVGLGDVEGHDGRDLLERLDVVRLSLALGDEAHPAVRGAAGDNGHDERRRRGCEAARAEPVRAPVRAPSGQRTTGVVLDHDGVPEQRRGPPDDGAEVGPVDHEAHELPVDAGGALEARVGADTSRS